jgi:dTDP-4-dehydrorhamnose 3,5-epimerase
LRHNSSSFLNWHGEILSPKNNRTMVIPEGFGHGFQTLTDDCELLYFHTALYCASAEGGVSAMDPRLAIHWPLAVSEMSERDRNCALLTSEFKGIVV